MHHHAEVQVDPIEKHCTHKLHFKTQQETCLICKAHFEKNYTVSADLNIVHLQSENVIRGAVVYTNAYVALIATSLRGPPSQLFS